jgi:hypothetical protein
VGSDLEFRQFILYAADCRARRRVVDPSAQFRNSTNRSLPNRQTRAPAPFPNLHNDSDPRCGRGCRAQPQSSGLLLLLVQTKFRHPHRIPMRLPVRLPAIRHRLRTSTAQKRPCSRRPLRRCRRPENLPPFTASCQVARCAAACHVHPVLMRPPNCQLTRSDPSGIASTPVASRPPTIAFTLKESGGVWM